jgi:hypothetical protein
MSICGTCGRQSDGDERFCGTCGTEFAGAPATVDGPTAESATRIDGPSARSDPFASWYQPPGGLPEGAGEQYPPTQTVLPAQVPAGYQAPQPGGYQPPSGPPGYQAQPPAGYPGPQPGPSGPPFPPGPPAGGPQRSGPRGLLIVLAVIVVLAAGGGAYALATTLGKHSTAQPPASPSVPVSPPAGGQASPAAPASSGPASSPAPSPTLSLVAVAPDAQHVSPSVEELLSHYFHGINTRDYAEYAGTLNATERADPSQSQAKFDAGYQTTTDSGMTVTSLGTTVGGTPGGLTATVTFTSRQSPSQSVDHSACNTWTLNFYLVPQGADYLIGPAPSGYAPDHSDC